MEVTKKYQSRRPVVIGVVIFIATLLITQYIPYQQYIITKETKHDDLVHELNSVKDRFRTILYYNISSANALAIIYKEYGEPKNYDSIAKQVMSTGKYIDYLQLTKGGVITNVYPLAGNEAVLGYNMLRDSSRRNGILDAIRTREIQFLGPQNLIQGGEAILCRVPIFIDNKFIGFSTTITRLSTIIAALGLDSNNSKFIVQLDKVDPATNKIEYFFSKQVVSNDENSVSVSIPEGNWKLYVAYNEFYPKSKYPITLSIFGILLSFMVSGYAYRKLKQPYVLAEIIESKTNQLASSENYFRTLIETSSDAIVLLDPKGAVIHQTPSTERISGYSLQEIKRLDGLELIHPDDRTKDNSTFIDMVKTPGATLRRTHRLKHKNGHYIWIEGTYRNLLHDESVKAIVYNYTDVTARLESELKLKERIKELSTIYNTNSILQDEKQGIDDVFNRIVALLPPGWQYPEICEARIVFNGQEYCTPNYADSPFMQSAAMNTIDGRTGMVEVVYTRQMPNEDEGPFLKEERDLINTLAKTIEVYFNKKSNQDALSKSEANLKSIFDNVQVAYLLLDVYYDIMEYNQYYKDGYAGLTGSVIEVGKNYLELMPAERRENSKKILESIWQDAKPVEFETYFINGETKTYFYVTVSPVLNNGAIIGFCVAGQNITNRKNIEIERQKISEQLQENASLLQLFIQHSPAALAMFDVNMNYIQVSNRWAHDYNLGDIDIIGKNHYDIFPRAQQYWRGIHKRGLRGAIERKDEDSFIREDGTMEWLQWEIRPWRKASGEIGGIIMFTEVITEKKEAELKFRNLVEKSLVGVYISQNGKFVYVNPQVLVESGYTEAELLSMPIDKFIHKDDLALMYRNVQARLDGEIDSVRYELRVTRKDGELMWLDMFGATTLYQGAPAIIGTMVNVTENKKVYNELKKSEANLRSVFDTTHVSYLLLDDQLKVLAYNQYLFQWYKDQTGIGIQVGISFLDQTVPDKHDSIKNALENAVKNSTSVEYESIYTNEGKVIYLTVAVTPVISNGIAIGVCMTGHDITNRKKIEMERQKMLNDLIQRNRDLEQFSHIVSHNVRGPLSTILGLNNMLMDAPAEEEREFIQEGIKSSSEKLDSVIKDLNEILQTRRELSELKVKVNLRDVVEDIKGSILLLISEKKVDITYDFAAVSDLLTVRSYINSIFYNLITNSIKFADPGRSPLIKIWTEQENERINICFRDNGIGIDLDRYRDRVFMLYNRFHHSVEGKGLGLFMTKTQVEVLNGTIDIESKLGEGTLIKVSFPE